MRIVMFNGWFILLLFTQTGCAFFSNLPLVPALLRSPVTLNTKDTFGPLNGPLTADEACQLELISVDISHGKDRKEAIKNNWPPRDQCTRIRKEGSDNSIAQNEIDLLNDLATSKVLVFVAISGGGTRAASLAAHTMSLLEKTLARVQRELGVPNVLPLVQLVDAFSTVSGGSLYAYQVARTKSYLDLVAPEDQKGASKSTASDGQPVPIPICDQNFGEPGKRMEAEESLNQIISYKSCFFYHMSKTRLARNIGLSGTAVYFFQPSLLFVTPFMTTFMTDINYTDLLAGTLAFTGYPIPSEWKPSLISLNPTQYARLQRIEGGGLNKPFSFASELKMGDLSLTPRFFFNTTALETGLPLVMTQRIMHLPSDRFQGRTARLDMLPASPRPLAHAYMLEEINSSPASMPLAYAAMSSASFPFGLEPVELQKYGFRPGLEVVYPTSGKLHVTDGGVYDNSGLTTLTDLYSYLTSKKNKEDKTVLVLLSINAEADDYAVDYPTRLAPPKSWYEKPPFSLLDFNFIPLRVDSLGVKALEVIHYTNKRRAEEIAISNILRIHADEKADLIFLPINFSQLSANDPYRIPDPNQLYESIKGIPTTFGLSSADESLIEQAANAILTSKQSPGWKVGPMCPPTPKKETDPSVGGNNEPRAKNRTNLFSEIKRLDEAFAFAVLRKSISKIERSKKLDMHEQWDVPELDEASEQSLVKEWCTQQRDMKEKLYTVQKP